MLQMLLQMLLVLYKSVNFSRGELHAASADRHDAGAAPRRLAYITTNAPFSLV
jgi:hypothetical protein